MGVSFIPCSQGAVLFNSGRNTNIEIGITTQQGCSFRSLKMGYSWRRSAILVIFYLFCSGFRRLDLSIKPAYV